MMAGNGQLSVPPGFRFHPTDEELLYYYLRKKVAFEAIDLDVIRDIDLNKVEPWDLKDKCRLGSGPQSDWYFFSHKDKKYPTGTRTNRATGAGFWKATGRDKVIHHGSLRRIGMRKTLVFYTGRAPHGQKTDWIMHEYRLDDDKKSDVQEEGWVVCRVFKKKSHQRADVLTEEGGLEENPLDHFRASGSTRVEQKQPLKMAPYDFSFDNSMHLPQLLSSESMGTAPLMATSASLSMTDPVACSSQHQLTKLAPGDQQLAGLFQHERFAGDWSILERLLGSHQNQDQIFQGRYGNPTLPSQPLEINCLGALRFPAQYHECGADLLKFSNK